MPSDIRHDHFVAVPDFPRLTEYASVWCMEPSSASALWDVLRRTDLAAHVVEKLAARTLRAFDDDDHDEPAEPPKPKSLIERQQARNSQTVAVIPVLGTLMKQRSSMGGTSTIQLRRDVRQAAADPEVGAILLAVESPGGVVAGTADLAADVRAARRRKPVWAHIDDLAASAAYWVASQAGQIFANANTALVGSIGTYQLVYDVSGAAEREGVKALLFATGPLKGAGLPGTQVTEEQQRYFQGVVDAMQAEFDAAVRAGRGLSAKELADVRTGGVFTAAEAQRLRLIDGVRSLDQTLNALADAAGQRVKGASRALVAGGFEGETR